MQYAVMQTSAGTTSGVQATRAVQKYRLNFLSSEKSAVCKMFQKGVSFLIRNVVDAVVRTIFKIKVAKELMHI